MRSLRTRQERFLIRQQGASCLKTEALCRAAKGREVKLIHFGKRDGAPERRVLWTARRHCCERRAGYAPEGMMEAIPWGAADGDHGAFP